MRERRRHPRTDGPAATGTVTGPVDEREVAAVGRRQRAHAAAAAALVLAAVVAVLVGGGAQRWSTLLLLLPTLAGSAVLLTLPFAIPRRRARTTALCFRLTAVSGAVTDCELIGVPTGAPPRTGEGMEIFGRPGPTVRADEIVRGDERLRGRPPITFLVARHAATVALVLAVVAGVAGVLALVVTV